MAGVGGFSTRCIHAGEAPDPTTGAHGVPLYQNVTFAFETNSQVEAMRSGDRPHFTYSPRGNPTVRCLELKIADLEGTEASVAMSSGHGRDQQCPADAAGRWRPPCGVRSAL